MEIYNKMEIIYNKFHHKIKNKLTRKSSIIIYKKSNYLN